MTTTAADARPLAERTLEATSAKDVDALRRLSHEDVVLDIVVGREIRGNEASAAFMAELFTALPDMQFAIDRMLSVDENIAVGQWSLAGTFEGGPFQGVKPTGRKLEIRGISVLEFKDGLLRRNTIYYDGLRFARQVGMLPTEGSTADRALTSTFNAVTGLRKAAHRSMERIRERRVQET